MALEEENQSGNLPAWLDHDPGELRKKIEEWQGVVDIEKRRLSALNDAEAEKELEYIKTVELAFGYHWLMWLAITIKKKGFINQSAMEPVLGMISVAVSGYQKLFFDVIDRTENQANQNKVTDILSTMAKARADGRWARLESVKEWAFAQRRNKMQVSRASVIREIFPEVVQMAKEAGEPLSGSKESVIATITAWFRKAGVK